jgi:PAS domain S-box-containing protein
MKRAPGTDAGDQLLALAADVMPEAMLTLDHRGTVTTANVAACALLGRQREELVGRSAHSVAHCPDAGHSEEECLLGAAAHSGEDPAEDLFVRNDGASFDVSYTCAALDLDGELPGSVLVFRDVTETKRLRRDELAELDDFAWVLRIREALERGDFDLYEQPVVELSEGEIAGHELLLRLTVDGELKLPEDFMGIAERYGLARELDRWVAREGIRRAARGRAIHINVSSKSLTPEFVDLVEREIDASGVDPQLLTFELGEAAVLDDRDAGGAFIRGLYRIGCHVAIDDFGNGGFGRLKELPVDYLKIDVAFVRGLSRHPENRFVVEAVVKLAQGFGQATIAEGVEDLATLQILDELGVDFAQGFALGRPAAPLAERRAA